MLTDIRIKDVRCEFEDTPFRAPLKFGGRVVDGTQVVNITATVETAGGSRGVGFGSMPLGNVWGWPSSAVEPSETAEAARRLAAATARRLAEYEGCGHPLEIGADLEHDLDALADGVTSALGVPERMPKLMALVAASAVDAALHDAYGKALDRNVYACYGPEFIRRDLASFLTPEFRGEYLDCSINPTPSPTLALYHLVGALDPLTPAEVTRPIGDGLPETLADWIGREGLTHLKIKLSGDDPDWDASRVIEVDRVASGFDRPVGDGWSYSLDFNERCPEAETVVGLLERLGREAPAALERVRYVEQPTSRDLGTGMAGSMQRASAIRPVVIDESLTGLESLLRARELGYSGVALKACKGQGQALLMAAYAIKNGMFLCVQDLTCPGASFLHSAGLAARLPGVSAVEGNGRQFCPAANRDWSARHPAMFRVQGGSVPTGCLTGPGLGH